MCTSISPYRDIYIFWNTHLLHDGSAVVTSVLKFRRTLSWNLNHYDEIAVHTTSTNSILGLQKLSCGSSLVVQQHAVLGSINSYESHLVAHYRKKIGIRFTSNIATKVPRIPNEPNTCRKHYKLVTYAYRIKEYLPLSQWIYNLQFIHADGKTWQQCFDYTHRAV